MIEHQPEFIRPCVPSPRPPSQNLPGRTERNIVFFFCVCVRVLFLIWKLHCETGSWLKTNRTVWEECFGVLLWNVCERGLFLKTAAIGNGEIVPRLKMEYVGACLCVEVDLCCARTESPTDASMRGLEFIFLQLKYGFADCQMSSMRRYFSS